MNKGFKLDFLKFKKHIQNFVSFIERNKAHNAKMNFVPMEDLLLALCSSCGELAKTIGCVGITV